MRQGDHVLRESARLSAKTDLEHDMTRLKVMHRSSLRVARRLGSGALWLSEARMVRRWMRPVRRAIRKARRRR